MLDSASYKTIHLIKKSSKLTRKRMNTMVEPSTQPLNNEMKTALFFVKMIFATYV